MAGYRLEHVGIVTAPGKRDENLKFYESVFGWHLLRDMGNVAFMGDGSGGRIEFLFMDGAPMTAPNHLAFLVPLDEFDAMVEKIKAAGAAPEEVRDGPSRLFFFRDPAGNRAQIVARTEPMPE